MYSKQESSQLRQAFWTAFGQYMSPLVSAEGEKINWLNYKTGIRNIRFTMQADNKNAYIAIELTHSDPLLRQIFYEQLKQLKQLLHHQLTEEWEWHEEKTNDHGATYSAVSKSLAGVSIFRKSDWPALISFFKPRLIALDEFWTSAKYGFEALM